MQQCKLIYGKIVGCFVVGFFFYFFDGACQRITVVNSSVYSRHVIFQRPFRGEGTYHCPLSCLGLLCPIKPQQRYILPPGCFTKCEMFKQKPKV